MAGSGDAGFAPSLNCTHLRLTERVKGSTVFCAESVFLDEAAPFFIKACLYRLRKKLRLEGCLQQLPPSPLAEPRVFVLAGCGVCLAEAGILNRGNTELLMLFNGASIELELLATCDCPAGRTGGIRGLGRSRARLVDKSG